MALTVKTTKNKAITTTVGSTAPDINTTIRKVSIPLVNLEELKNVNSDDLNDGYTLVYDSTTNQWITQSADELALNLQNIDGGTY
jgi:hypothetical protein